MPACTKHLFFARSRGDREAFRRRTLDQTAAALTPLAPGGLKLSLTADPPPRLTVLPLRRDNLLMVSAWGDVDTAAVARALEGPGVEFFGYAVDESYPVRNERTWPLGERSPGVVLLTLLARHPRFDPAAFVREWHGVHTPKALRIHPLWSYVRNVVTSPVAGEAPPFDGVVEEHFRTRADLLNPVRMFGGVRRFAPNMVEIARHARYFLDLQQTENYLLAEWRLIERG
ncbi:MAG: EthD domain-containing protein [Myxococcales bacterium]|nr:EthD domain-containing protein [Myxococcales bacterium]